MIKRLFRKRWTVQIQISGEYDGKKVWVIVGNSGLFRTERQAIDHSWELRQMHGGRVWSGHRVTPFAGYYRYIPIMQD